MSVNNLLNDSGNKGWANLFINSLTIYNNLIVRGDAEFVGNVQFDNFDINNIDAGPPDTFLSTNGATQVVWEPIAAAPNTIYTDDSTLTGNRALDGGNNNLSFNNLTDFTVNNTGNTTISSTGDIELAGTDLNINATNATITPLPTTNNSINNILTIDGVTNRIHKRDAGTLSASPERFVTVAQSGGDYTDLNAALTAVSALTPVSGDEVTVYIYSGTYDLSATLTVPKFVKLVGIERVTITRTSGGATDVIDLEGELRNITITSDNNTGDIITTDESVMKNCAFIINGCNNVLVVTTRCTLSNCTFAATTSANNAYIDITGVAELKLNNVGFLTIPTQTNGLIGTGNVFANNCNFNCINLTDAFDLTSQFNTHYFQSCRFFDGDNILTCDGTAFLNSCVFEDNNADIITDTTTVINLNGCDLDEKKVLNKSGINDLSKLRGQFLSLGSNSVKFTSDINAGDPVVPQKAVIGGGFSYPIPSAKQCTATGPADNGSAFNDITNTLASDDGSATGAFSSTAANNCLLLGSDIATFSGIKIDNTLAVNLGAGAILIEYYSSGSTQFEPANVMSTEAAANYNSSANVIFELGEYHYRFNIDQSDMGLVTIDGLEAYYLRFRITSAISLIPQVDYVRIHSPNSFVIENDGFRQYFNNTSTDNRLVSLITPSITAPGNQNLFLATDFEIGYTRNAFNSGLDHYISFYFPVPENCDTSKLLRVFLKYVPGGGASNDVLFDYKAAYVTTYGDNNAVGMMYDTSGTAPANAAGEIINTTSTVAIDGTDIDRVRVFEIGLDVSPAVCRRKGIGSETSDLIFIQFARLGADAGDTYVGNIRLAGIEYNYNTWY